MNRNILMSALLALAGCGLSSADGQTGRSREPIVSCPTSPAKEVFASALGLCGDYQAVGEGAWVQGGPAGINGVVDVVGKHDFSGDVVAFEMVVAEPAEFEIVVEPVMGQLDAGAFARVAGQQTDEHVITLRQQVQQCDDPRQHDARPFRQRLGEALRGRLGCLR